MEPRGHVYASREPEKANRMQSGSTAKFARTTAVKYWVVTPTAIFSFEFEHAAAQIWQILTTKINVTTDLGCTAAEIEQIVTKKINVTIDFRPTAAEIEQIVTLIANVKRNV